jgi:hypothetical protein
MIKLHCCNQLLVNNGMQQLLLLGNNIIERPQLLERIVEQQWDLGSHWSKNDLRSLLEDIAAEQ